MENRIPDTNLEREEAEQRDVEIINRNADRLNAEAEDALDFQVTHERPQHPSPER